jgi:putative FmdB family regulatory protein
MPLYEYYCDDCHGVFELLRPQREASDPQPCPECDADSRRIVSAFEAFTFRDGYPRKIPDDGTYWHLGQKVSSPITGAVQANEHPELLKKKRRPPAPPTTEEIEAHAVIAREHRQQSKDRREAGLGKIIDTQAEQKLGAFNKRLRQTAGQAKLKRRRKPNAETTARTVTGRHGSSRKARGK